MTTILAQGSLLTASAEDRTLTYRLLPFGEEGRTNVGKVTASKGVLTIPDPSTLVANLEHDATRPVAKFTSVTEEDNGLTASVRVLATQAGNDLLTEAAEGVRTGISVEIENPVIRAGRLISGVLSGAGFVTKPAFVNATLMAADAGDLPEEIEINGQVYRQVENTEEPNVDSENAAASAESENTVSDNLTAAAPAVAPQGLHASAPASVSKTDAFKALAAAYNAGGTNKMLAALSDIVPGDILGLEQPQFVGELWAGRAYQRKIVPLFNRAALTSFEVKGWRWVTKPTVAPYSGNKTAVPSNAVETEPVTVNAERIAGAHDIDRKFRDFPSAGFWEAYFAAMTESYAKVSDAQVLADVLAAATDVTRGTVPTGVSPALVSIVDGALSVLDATDTLPTFALVSTSLYRDLLFTRTEDTLAYLNAGLGLEDGTVGNFRIQPSGALTAGSVLVGSSSAVTVHELGGEAPIRVEAENIAQGGVDVGVFGYYAVNVHNEDGLALVTAGV